MASTTQINKSISRISDNTFNAALGNFNLINALTTVVDSSARITDLVLPDITSDTQTLLASIKTILDYVVSRGFASITTVLADSATSTANSVKYNFFLQYAVSSSSVGAITLYQIDLTDFYTASDNAGTFAATSNSLLYASTDTNAYYITKVNNVINSLNTVISLNKDLTSVF
jgi:hypothetical protein